MAIFNISDEKMQATSSVFTLSEIYQQPATWKKTCAQIAACKDEQIGRASCRERVSARV